MIHSSAVQLPRVSANQLGEFAFASDSQKRAIVHNHKFGNPHSAPYYQAALTGVLQSFEDGRFQAHELRKSAMNLRHRPASSPNQSARLHNNAEMLTRFTDILGHVTPPSGQHQIVRRNAFMPLDGVVISVRPEILTRLAGSREFCFTKLRFSKSKVSDDASEIILLILLEYGARQSSQLATFRADQTVLVDCFARTVHRGHRLPAVRQRQLTAALRDYRHRWAEARLPDTGSDPRAAVV